MRNVQLLFYLTEMADYMKYINKVLPQQNEGGFFLKPNKAPGDMEAQWKSLQITVLFLIYPFKKSHIQPLPP